MECNDIFSFFCDDIFSFHSEIFLYDFGLLRCKATRFSVQILRSQLRWLRHILRREPTDPLRLQVIVFEPNTALLPRLRGTDRKKVVGRPRIDWAQTSIEILGIMQGSRNDLLKIVLDQHSYHSIVERLCSQVARDQQLKMCCSLLITHIFSYHFLFFSIFLCRTTIWPCACVRVYT